MFYVRVSGVTHLTQMRVAEKRGCVWPTESMPFWTKEIAPNKTPKHPRCNHPHLSATLLPTTTVPHPPHIVVFTVVFLSLALCSKKKKWLLPLLNQLTVALQQKQIIFGRFHHSVINGAFGVFVHCPNGRLVIVFLQPIVQMLLGSPAGQH